MPSPVALLLVAVAAYFACSALAVVLVRHRNVSPLVYGASFGAYHAVNFGSRHPDQVSKVIAFSGKYDVHGFLDGWWDELCYFHCPTAYLPNLNGEWVQRLGRIQYVVATGEHDHLADANRDLVRILGSKGLPVHGEIWQGQFGHDWPYWREHLRRFLP